VDEITAIAGQKASAKPDTKKDISNFKLRKNMPMGLQ